MKTRSLCIIFFGILIALLLTTYSSVSAASQPLELTPESTIQPQAGSHPPVILQVIEREEIIDGFLYVYNDIYFADPDGDAVAITYTLISSSLTYPLSLTDDPITASAEEQKVKSLFTFTGRCWQKVELVFESRIRDQAGNVSDPVTFRMSCTTPPVVDTRSILVNGLITAFSIALILVLGFWLLFGKHPSERLPVLRSTLILFCLFLVLRFMHLVLHEGGHGLYLVARGIPGTLYVHPFFLAGYYRPAIDNSIWKDILGSAISLPLSLLISLPFWRRRSTALVPLVMLFPYSAIYNGINILGIAGGDFQNLVQTNGLSPVPFYCLGALIILVGLITLFTLLPLIGLDPKDKRSLFVFPAAMFLISVLSFIVAFLFVPGSSIDREYFLGQEIMAGANSFLYNTVFGVILAVLYITLYRKIYPRLPGWLRTEKVELTWKDLRIPELLAVISVILGIIIIM